MKTTPGSCLGGAIGRLLPASIPFRYFGAAAAFHVCAWLALSAGADSAPRYRGGLGWTLAALHLITLGVLTMTAIGASLQLLPVATRQAVRSRHAPALVFWLYAPGVAAAALGMGVPSVPLLAAGIAGLAHLLVRRPREGLLLASFRSPTTWSSAAAERRLRATSCPSCRSSASLPPTSSASWPGGRRPAWRAMTGHRP